MRESSTIGKAKTVLVFGEGHAPVAVTTNLIAQGSSVRRRTRPRFTGTAVFDEALKQHVEQVILPIVDRIGDLLKAPKLRFEISAANIGAASGFDRGVQISGFSADVPLFLALLSARLEIPVPAGIASTGHIASPDGDIRWVRHLPAKLGAAAKDAGVKLFICPAVNEDSSVDTMAPREKDRNRSAIAEAKGSFRVVQVTSIARLIKHVFRDEDVIAGALATGFFAVAPPVRFARGTVNEVATHLATGNDGRFWRTVEAEMLEMRVDEAREAIGALTRHFVSRQSYPGHLGRRLRQLLLSLPPITRRAVLSEPVISVAACIQLSQFASEADQKDVQTLFRVADMASGGERDAAPLASAGRSPSQMDGLVGTILADISPDSLARNVGLAIDSARAAYVMDSVTVKDSDECLQGVAAFYLHVLRHLGTVDGPADPKALGPDALMLLRRAFRDEGGEKLAYAEAIEGTRGGMRYVLDRMTNQFKREQTEQYIEFALERIVVKLDWEAKCALMTAMLQRLRLDLPSDIAFDTPERYVEAVKTIARAWSGSIDQLRMVVRSM